MRILHVLDHSLPLHSGYSFRTLSILREQRAMGWETFHLTGPKQEGCAMHEERVEGWHFFRTRYSNRWLPDIPGLSEIGLMSEISHRLEEVVRSVKPHILHAHSPVLNAIPALRVARRHNIPLVYEVRAFWEDAAVDHGFCREGGLRYRLTHGLETYALKHADAITTICEGLRWDIISRGISDTKVTVIPNAVDTQQFSMRNRPDPGLRSALGLDGCVVLGFIGSFYAYEGLELLLHAFPRITQQAPNARILLVGGGPHETSLKELASKLAIAQAVIFAGRVPHGEVQNYYEVIDILIYPRLAMRLTDLVTPLKPLEAMAQGRLIVASNVGGHRELITNEKTGILFRPGDSEDLASKVLDLIRHPESWSKLKTGARRFVETERTWAASAARYRDVYSRLSGDN
jgi:PEP-CTERM/exosortase A-associated glycosyltransferase